MEKNSCHDKPRLCVVAGLPRAGSTFIYHNLGIHPNIFAPFRKETNFFLTNYQRGLDWYLSLFAERTAQHQYCLDVSPSYFLDPISIKRMKNYDPDVKVIIILRRLDELAVSWYEQQLTHVKNFITFEQFLHDWSAKRGDGDVHIDMSKQPFKRAIMEYQEVFKDNLLLINFEEVDNNSLHVLQAIEKFLDLPKYYAKGNYTDGAINAQNRTYLRPLNWLLSQEKVISAINFLFPRSLIINLRARFDKVSMPKKALSRDSDPRRLRAQEVLSDDIEYVNAIFNQHNIVLGNTTPMSTIYGKGNETK